MGSGEGQRPQDRPAAVEAAIEGLLRRAGVPFRVLRHEPVRTAEEAARARHLPLAAGVKALVLKVDDRFLVLALPADRTLSSRALRRRLGARRARFADARELIDLTGLAPGSIPPFGPPVLDLELVADRDLALRGEVAFTPGRADRSVLLAAADWLRVARPRLAELTQPGGAGEGPDPPAR